jgi:hypothetical protein
VGGFIRMYITPGSGTGAGTVVIIGAIGDFGKVRTVNLSGSADPTGNYLSLKLQKGAFEVNRSTLVTEQNSTLPTLTPATCSGLLTTTAPVTLFNGSGLYSGITGAVSATLVEAFVLPRYSTGKSKGQCELTKNVQPLTSYISITGMGSVAFN